MTCNVNIHAARKEDVLRIPIMAFGELEGVPHVKLKQGEEFVPTPVTLGLRSDAFAEVSEGLSEGDEIAADCSDLGGEAQGGRAWRRMR